MATEEQTIIQREAPEVEALKLGLIRAAKGLAETAPVGGLPQTQFAGYDPFQDRARTMAESAIGSFAPFLTDFSMIFRRFGKLVFAYPDYISYHNSIVYHPL